jgi:hypothetical protein
MPTESEREERPVWKLGEGGYTVQQVGRAYIATDQHGAQTKLADLAALIAFADAVYDSGVDGEKDHAERVKSRCTKFAGSHVFYMITPAPRQAKQFSSIGYSENRRHMRRSIVRNSRYAAPG